MHHRSHTREEGLLPGGSASWGPAPSGGLHPRVVCIQGVCIQGELGRPSTPEQHGIRSISGRYTSYWNAFLFYFFRFLIKAPFHSQIDHLRFPFSMHKILKFSPSRSTQTDQLDPLSQNRFESSHEADWLFRNALLSYILV